MITALLSSPLLFALLGSAWAAGPISPAPQDDGTDSLDGAAELPADSGAGLVYFGARTPFTKTVQGEFFGGFAGQVGIAHAVSIGLSMPDARRLSLSGDAHRLAPGSIAFQARVAPLGYVEDLALTATTARPIGEPTADVPAWELRVAYGRDLERTRVFANTAVILPEQGAVSAWLGAGMRTEFSDAVGATADAWISTKLSARVSGSLGWRFAKGLELSLVAAPSHNPTKNNNTTADEGGWGFEAMTVLNLMMDPREQDLRGDRDGDGIFDDLDSCPLTPGTLSNGCPARLPEGMCGCTLDDMDPIARGELIDLLRQPVPGKVMVVQVWAAPTDDDQLGWQDATADAAAVLDTLMGSGISTYDLRVLAMGIAPTESAPRLQVQLVETWQADKMAAEVGDLAPTQPE